MKYIGIPEEDFVQLDKIIGEIPYKFGKSIEQLFSKAIQLDVEDKDGDGRKKDGNEGDEGLDKGDERGSDKD